MATHLFLAGLVRVEQGQLARASKAFLDAASVNREIHDQAALRWCLAGLAMAEAMSGHTERAAAAAAEREELPAGSMLAYEPDLIERGRAWLGQPGQVAPRLAVLAGITDGDLVPALAAHAAAMATASPPGLESAGHALEALGACLLAAEAYLAAAAGYRSGGHARPASAMTRRAGELAALCGDVSPPGLSFGSRCAAGCPAYKCACAANPARETQIRGSGRGTGTVNRRRGPMRKQTGSKTDGKRSTT